MLNEFEQFVEGRLPVTTSVIARIMTQDMGMLNVNTSAIDFVYCTPPGTLFQYQDSTGEIYAIRVSVKSENLMRVHIKKT